jgi:peptidyl-prolyl cis-trans isomerase B (cyclophilin B)
VTITVPSRSVGRETTGAYRRLATAYPVARERHPPRLADRTGATDGGDVLAGSAKRERQLAREHYERQQARRREAQLRRRKSQQIAAVVVALLLVAGGVVWLAVAGDDDATVATKGEDSASPTATGSASPSSTPSATEGAGCTYTKAGEASKDAGLPTYDADTPEKYTKPFTATIRTNRGPITVEMAAAEAPCTTNSFRHLAEAKYFDGTSCHRLTTGGLSVLQCGDPTGTGSGGPGYQFGEENLPADATNNYPAGTVAMANAGAGTNGSQFFLVYKDSTLPPNYTIFGTITGGLDVVTKVAEAGVEGGGEDGKPATPVTIERVTIGKA